jgi:hypothetical protein
MFYHVGEIDRDRDHTERTRGLPSLTSRSSAQRGGRTLTTKHAIRSRQGHNLHTTD